MKKVKKFLILEKDDDLPIHLQANTMEEMKNKLVKLFKEGFCDCYLMTREEYQEFMKEEDN